ncbi:uncharacterized protein LOC8277463 isoform X1 [Ricinus communis]|uniref:uncharacterized protein LOC8277463 isoform X1 n=2 Tax=Ricinus communis TaxID=3988 RepID=UPI0007728BD0|nr:uncharacterized protein LOC8277463 isoform X1 [Ricinus communis]|eukprot:XP_015582806.1 uncharacterized protein LOC8277463 isoform X1 [Ricinus communis]
MELNTSDPEMLNSSYSLSLPSEPPDIGNWFPSYKYESFVLDTYDDAFGGSAFKESDCDGGDGCVVDGEKNIKREGNLGECKRNGNSDDKQEEQDLNPDSVHSLSHLSEPPHIRNWFSSYVYESPELDTLDDLKLSVTKECEYEKGMASEENNGTREYNLHESRNSWNSNGAVAGGVAIKCANSIEDTSSNKTSSQIPDSSHSSPILLEPPDIRNWYFSYVHESPETNECVGKETERGEDGLVNHHEAKGRNLCKFGQSRNTDEVIIDEEVGPNGFLKFDNSIRDELENQSLNKGNKAPGSPSSSNWDNLCCERGQNLEYKICTNHHSSSIKDPEKENLNHEDPPCRQQQKQNFLQEADVVSCNGDTDSSNNSRISPTRLFSGTAQREDVLLTVAGDSMRKPTCGSNDKENVRKKVENGFVTTKKHRVRPNDENSFPKPQKVLSECSRKKRETSSDGNDAMERKVLWERTNLEVEHIDAIEVTGKWRCPQKSKPNTGPPLKQLRLERWVHRS